jgi:DNA-directed RNA polymerase subunit RPC12/RpoP
MATLFEYKCKSCKYTVAAHPKGHDMIMMGEQYTYHCEDCKDIVYVVNLYGEKPEKIVCPECGSEKLVKWNPRTGKCPKCGDKMEKTGMVLMVD